MVEVVGTLGCFGTGGSFDTFVSFGTAAVEV